MLKEINDEFDSTIPFFYDIDYENVDLKKNVIIKINKTGKVEHIPLVQIIQSKLKKEKAKNIEDFRKQLKLIRGDVK